MTKTPKNIRQRKRKVQVQDKPAQEPAEPKDPLHPGPQVNWPPYPKDSDNNPLPVPPPSRIRVLYEMDRDAYHEFMRNTLIAMVAAQRPRDEIARTFGTTVEQVGIWLKWLKEEMRKQWMARDQLDFAVSQEASYRRIIAYAWQQAGQTEDTNAKNRWIALAGRMEQAMGELYREARIYRTLPHKRAYGDEGDDDMTGDGLHKLQEKAGSLFKKALATVPKMPNADDDIQPPTEGID